MNIDTTVWRGTGMDRYKLIKAKNCLLIIKLSQKLERMATEW